MSREIPRQSATPQPGNVPKLAEAIVDCGLSIELRESLKALGPDLGKRLLRFVQGQEGIIDLNESTENNSQINDSNDYR